MNKRYRVKVHDWQALSGESRGNVQIGHYFVFLEAGALGGRGQRLHMGGSGRHVLPLIEQPVEFPGGAVVPGAPALRPLGSVTSDRDLYRAEEDSARLFLVAPDAPADVELVVTMDGQPFTERRPELSHGVGIEVLGALLPGRYEAFLRSPKGHFGERAHFTVAEYCLAPMSAKLTRHELKRTDVLSFALSVESYQVPFEGALRISLVEDGRSVSSRELRPTAPGTYEGSLRILGDGPFELQLVATQNPALTAEVALPGSARKERETTLISELGAEVHFGLMPEPAALPVRGGFVSEGASRRVPLVNEHVVCRNGQLRAERSLEALTLIVADLARGCFSVREVGDVVAGETIEVPLETPACTVVAGGYIDGRPFEGFTSYLREQRLSLSLQAPEQATPGEDLEITLRTEALGTVPVLLSVRDRRLSQHKGPATSLAASCKHGFAVVTEPFEDGRGIEPLVDDTLPPIMTRVGAEMPSRTRERTLSAPRTSERPATMSQLALGGGTLDKLRVLADEELSAEPESQGPRDTFLQTLFYDVVWLEREARVPVRLGDALTTYSIEAFALHGGDWVERDATLVVDQPVRIDLQVPPMVHPRDEAMGCLRASTTSGRMRVEVRRDGEPLQLSRQGEPLAPAAELLGDQHLTFALSPGEYHAIVEDLASGERDEVACFVGEPGKLRTIGREVVALQQGAALDASGDGILALRILPGIDGTLDGLVEATSNYQYLCCEQTAARILAGIFMLLGTEDPRRRRQAEEIILAGIEREERMWWTQKGFCMYPDAGHINHFYSQLAVKHLWSLRGLEELPSLSRSLRRALVRGLEMADDVAKAHGLRRVPKNIACAHDAWVAIQAGDEALQPEARAYLDALVDDRGALCREAPKRSLLNTIFGASGPRWDDPVTLRAERAYAAAALLRLGDLRRGIRLANDVTSALGSNGMLYSTVDSVAAIAMMAELQKRHVGKQALVAINGEEMSAAEAIEFGDLIESVSVIDGVALVEVSRLREEDWMRFADEIPLRVDFGDDLGSRPKLAQGQRVTLRVALPRGYQFGDLLHVCLPPSLSRLSGGGQVKRFSLDFAGEDELEIPLVVTGKLVSTERFTLCMRNMFEETRGGCPGVLAIEPSKGIPAN
ncbi:MAG: hypothetical protein OXU20_19310 [Myxococcales bacterium]|nr:hypothetical protein [Myxococcales bacterium]